MWSSKRSRLMLVRISLGGPRKIIIPIPLYVLDITISAVADLTLLTDLFSPLWKSKLQKIFAGHHHHKLVVKGALVVKILQEMLLEFRKHGRWNIVKIQTGKVQISVDFY